MEKLIEEKNSLLSQQGLLISRLNQYCNNLSTFSIELREELDCLNSQYEEIINIGIDYIMRIYPTIADIEKLKNIMTKLKN